MHKEIQKLLKDSRGSHDLDHTMRVHALCLHIGKIEKANMKILEAAALLHDIARPQEDKEKGRVCHAELGAKMAAKILQKNNYNPDEIDQISHCIATHRFRGKLKPESLEARILFDADKLDSIGAVGIGRTFLFAGEIGAKLHNKGIDIAKTKPYTKEDTAYREFMIKLRHISSRMLTREGKRLAKNRHKFMVDFFKRLDHEISGEL
ncbi:HD domain-containing protein [Patescibacteria group bacterium]|nr:HD domain-containing protein [Patescibacteria group bacterium]